MKVPVVPESLPLFPALLPFVPFQAAHDLPAKAGIYFALLADGKPLYIGATTNLHLRWSSHHKRHHLEAQQCATIAYYLCEEADLDALERAMIQWFCPLLNGPWRPRQPRSLQHMQRVCLFVAVPQFIALTKLALRLGLSFSEVLRRAIDAYLNEQSS